MICVNLYNVCGVQSDKMQRVVNELIKDLNAESELRRGKQRDKNLDKVEAGLAKARALIRDATLNQSCSSPLDQDADYVPHGDIYQNPYVFHR